MPCAHVNLTLLVSKAQVRLRCRHCHLTIDAAEIGKQPCPECLEQGRRRRDFDEVEVPAAGASRARCEDCGLMIDL